MKGRTLTKLLIIFLVVVVNQGVILSAFCGIFEEQVSARVIKVPEDYLTIQQAIDVANDGDTILVSSRTYNEDIIINKRISLFGEDEKSTVIIGTGIGTVVQISSNCVNVSRFTIKGSGNNYISPFDGGDAGVKLDRCVNCTISDCIIIENCLGIFLNLSSHNILEDNICHSNSKDGIYLRLSNNNMIRNNTCYSNGGHAGIYLNPSNSYNLIENNTCYWNSLGIKLQESSNFNILKYNNFSNNWDAGIFLRTSDNNMLNNNTCNQNEHNPGIILVDSCDNNTIVNNLCNFNDEGIALQHACNNNRLIDNTIIDNKVRGILLLSSGNNMIIRNMISLNGKDPRGTAGIYLDNSSHNEICHNNILMNWRGILISGENSVENKIHQNNIAKNVEWGLLNEASTEVNATFNWWGSPYGPKFCQFVEETDSEDPEEVKGKMLYEPWLTEPWGDWFKLTNLSISPIEVKIGEKISISINVTNVGYVTGAIIVTLRVNSTVEATKELTLAEHKSTLVIFEISKDSPGIYYVEIDGLTGTFVVKATMPAEFIITGLSISPTEVEIGQKITVSVKVTNVGEENGSYTVELKVNGETVDYRIVTLAGGESTIVTFELTEEEAGTYDVEISGLKDKVIVKEIFSPTPTPTPRPTPTQVATPMPTPTPTAATAGLTTEQIIMIAVAVMVTAVMGYLAVRAKRKPKT